MAVSDEKGLFKTEPTSTTGTVDTNDRKVVSANLLYSPLAFCRQLLNARHAAKAAREQQKVEMEIQECLPIVRSTTNRATVACTMLSKVLEAKCAEIATRADYTSYAVETLLPPPSNDVFTPSYQDFKTASYRSMTQLTRTAGQAAQTAAHFARLNVDMARALLDEACVAELYGPFYGHAFYSSSPNMPKKYPLQKRPTQEHFQTVLAALDDAIVATAAPNDDWHIPDSQYEKFNHLHIHLKRMRNTFMAHHRLEKLHDGFGTSYRWWYQGKNRTTSSAFTVLDVARRIGRAYKCLRIARDAMICADEVRQRTADQIIKELRALGPSCTIVPKQLEQVDVTFGAYSYYWFSSMRETSDMNVQATHIMKTAFFGMRARPHQYY